MYWILFNIDDFCEALCFRHMPLEWIRSEVCTNFLPFRSKCLFDWFFKENFHGKHYWEKFKLIGYVFLFSTKDEDKDVHKLILVNNPCHFSSSCHLRKDPRTLFSLFSKLSQRSLYNYFLFFIENSSSLKLLYNAPLHGTKHELEKMSFIVQ